MNPSIDEIRQKITDELFEFSKHALDQSISRDILLREIREVIVNAVVIEDYPTDKYGPSCLLCGVTQAWRTIHIQCSYPSRPILKIITLYEPDRLRWNYDFTKRRIDDESPNA
jgi:Domain of unknown function (DUF4258)